jgi:hypothetical protein
MTDPGEYQRYRRDAAVLADIGRHLEKRVPLITVRLPRQLAEAAFAAWRRDEQGTTADETPEQRTLRSNAADLALIGAAVAERGHAEGAEVVVKLDVIQLAAALTAHYEPVTE